jgi:hypothetical protein
MYAQIDQFAIDKGLNTVVEEGIAPLYIRRQRKKVRRVDKLMADAQASKAYDLIDGLGVK